MRWFYRAIGGGAWPVMRSHVSWCTKAMRVSLLRQDNGRSNTTWFSWRRWWRSEVWNNGCFVRLGRCCIVIWRLIAHYYYYWGCTTGASPLLFCTVIWCLTRRPGCYMSLMSATGSTEFMKASVDGGVQDTAWVFSAWCDPSIQTRTKKRRGRVFSRAAGRGV